MLGFLCAVPIPENFPNPEMDAATPTGWAFQFSTEVSVYYKCQETRDLDEHLGDLHGFIIDREVEIIQALTDTVMEHEKVLVEVSDILAEMDALLAFADATRECKSSKNVLPSPKKFC